MESTPERLHLSLLSVTRSPSTGLLLTTSRIHLQEVLGRCSSLKREITKSHHRLASGLAETFTRCRHELEKPLSRRWKDSPVYVRGRERILRRGREETQLISQVAEIKSKLGDEREVRLTVKKKTQVNGKKVRNVEEPIVLSAQSIGTFLLARKMIKDQRNFGEQGNGDQSKGRRESMAEDMSEFWKGEIGKYERERRDRIYGPELRERARRISLLTVPVKDSKGLSPLQLYVQKYTREKILGKGSTFPRRNRIEERMNTIQPSPEVAILALKYQTRPPAYYPPVKLTKQPPRATHSVPKVVIEEEQEDAFIKAEIRKEMQDTEKQLNIEALLSDEVRKTRVRKNASTLR